MVNILVVMYSYYFLISFERVTRLIMIVKSLITFVQIFQMVILLKHFMKMVLACGNSTVYYAKLINTLILVVDIVSQVL